MTRWFRSRMADGSRNGFRARAGHLLDGEGHLSIPVHRLDEIVDELLERRIGTG